MAIAVVEFDCNIRIGGRLRGTVSADDAALELDGQFVRVTWAQGTETKAIPIGHVKALTMTVKGKPAK